MRKRKTTKHHVPPVSVGDRWTKHIILMKTKETHAAYHLLFANAASYTECCQILYNDWWRDYETKKG